MVNNELQHHGVKGMKWGVIREKKYERSAKVINEDAKNLRKHGYVEEAKAVSQVAKRQKEKARKLHKINEEREKTRKKSVKNMSDQELRDRTNRINLERNYKRAVHPYRTQAKDVFMKGTVVALSGMGARYVTKKIQEYGSEAVTEAMVKATMFIVSHEDAQEDSIVHEEDDDESIEHHGVKGMKWGVIRNRKSAAERRDAKFEKRLNKSLISKI